MNAARGDRTAGSDRRPVAVRALFEELAGRVRDRRDRDVRERTTDRDALHARGGQLGDTGRVLECEDVDRSVDRGHDRADVVETP